MKKNVFIFILLLLVFPTKINASSYRIVNYNIEFKIYENRTVDIKEEYNLYLMQKDSFKKQIPNAVTIIRPNESKITNKLKISNISIILNGNDVNYNLNNNEIIIPDIDENGIKKLTISYSYDYGKDLNKTIDEIFLNITNNIDSEISMVNFKIEFPKEIDSSKIKFLYNKKYTNDNVIYNINGNVISGFLNKSLNENENIDVYVEFPNNYFINTNTSQLPVAIMILPIATLIFSIIYYLKYSKNNKIKIITSDKIPYDFNSAEIAYLYKGYLTEHDLMTIFISLANEGYIKYIESDDGYKLGTFNSFVIQKIKDYDKDNAVIKIIFEKIFQKKDIVQLQDIEYNLYDTLVDAKSTIDNDDNKKRIFFTNSKKSKNILRVLIIISIIMVNFDSIYLFTNKYFLFPIFNVITIIGIYMLLNNNKILMKIIGLLLTIGTLFIGLIPYIDNFKNLIIYIISMTLILISSILCKKIQNRTIYGNQMLSEIYGFKRALELLNNEEIKEKMSINPNYYYDMYPYIYVLDLTNMWIRKFENIIKEYPSWYITKEEFSLNNFQNFIKNMIFTITQAMFKRQLTGQSSVHVEYHKDSIKQSKLL